MRRLTSPAGGRGGIGRHARFRFWWRKPWGFKSLRPHQSLRSSERQRGRELPGQRSLRSSERQRGRESPGQRSLRSSERQRGRESPGQRSLRSSERQRGRESPGQRSLRSSERQRGRESPGQRYRGSGSMQVTETLSEGLKRGFTVVVPAADIEGKRTARLVRARQDPAHARLPPRQGAGARWCEQRYGNAVAAEVLEESVSEATRQVLSDRGLRAGDAAQGRSGERGREPGQGSRVQGRGRAAARDRACPISPASSSPG